MAGLDSRGPIGRVAQRIPHEVWAIAEDAMILALIVVAATSAEKLTELLLGEHINPIISFLLTASLWVMGTIYAIMVVSTLSKLVVARFAPDKDRALKMFRTNKQGATPTQLRRASDRPLSVMVVDDDSLVSGAVKRTLALDARIGTVTTANCPDAAVAKISSGPEDEAPDVVLLDINYVGIEKTGIDCLPEIRETSPRSKLLIMSVNRERDIVRAALENGADGFIWKNESAVDFAEAVVGAAHHSFVASKSIALDVMGTA
jgi:CheY-like chemotaxis protein